MNKPKEKQKTITVKQWMETPEYLYKKKMIQDEINAEGQLNINRSEFTKTDLEKAKLKDMKVSYAKLIKNPAAHKQSRINFVKAILNSDVPKFGNCLVKVAAL